MGQTKTRSHTLSWRWMAKFLDFCTHLPHVAKVTLTWSTLAVSNRWIFTLCERNENDNGSGNGNNSNSRNQHQWRYGESRDASERTNEQMKKKKKCHQPKWKYGYFICFRTAMNTNLCLNTILKCIILTWFSFYVRIATYTEHAPTHPSRTEREEKIQLKNLNSISVSLFHNQHNRIYVYETVVIV